MSALENQIDRDYLSEISGGDAEFEQELVSTFLESAPELIQDYRTALDSDDAHKAVHAAHTLKGSSRSIGANDFANVCEAAEKSAREGDLATCRTIIPHIEAAFRALSTAGRAFLDQAA